MKKIILAGVAALSFSALALAQQPPAVPSGDILRTAAVADAERQFRLLDSDGNGTLDAAELQKAAEQRRAERRQRMEKRLASMSAEDRARFEERRAERAEGGGDGGRRGGWGRGSGRGEGMSGRPTTLAEFRARAEQRFDRLDLDKNGVITAAEQAQLRAARADRSE